MNNQNKTIFFLGIFSVCLFVSTYGQGTLVNDSFFSSSLERTQFVDVYLPEGYNPNDVTLRYPVIYFLHGAGGNQDSYENIVGILDRLIGDQIINPTIVVKPDGSASPYAGSFYTNSELYGQFEDYIVQDISGYIDSNYNTFVSHEKRGIMGHSMGGYGAMKLALKHPDFFSCVAAHSGPLDFNHISDLIPSILSETGGTAPYNYSPNNGIFSYLVLTVAGAFSPNLNNPPYNVNFILDTDGNIIDSVFTKWLLHNPSDIVATLPANYNLSIYFDCGTQDELLLFPFNTGFADSLDKFNIEYEFRSYIGNHSNQIDKRFPISITFLDSVMKSNPVEVNNEIFNTPLLYTLNQNYPNPFNPNTVIKYTIPRQSNVTIKVFDVLGSEVATLINKEQSQGNYEVEFDASTSSATGSELSSGIYFYRIQAGEFIETKKMILIK